MKNSSKRIVIVGAGGRLGAALVREYSKRHAVTGFNHAQLDLGAPEQLHEKLDSLGFDLLINCAAQTNVDRCEQEKAEAFRLNAEAPEILAQIATAKSARMIHISTDYVFDGEKSEPYREEDEARAISVYGESKLEGEKRVLRVSADHLVARVSWIFGPDRPSFIDWVIQQARTKEHVEAVADKFSTPSYTCDVAQMLEALWSQPSEKTEASKQTSASLSAGLVHLTNAGECSWQEYGQWAVDCCAAEGVSLQTRVVHPIKLASMKNFIAQRPPYTVLATTKYEKLTGQKPRPWQEAVREYVREQIKPG